MDEELKPGDVVKLKSGSARAAASWTIESKTADGRSWNIVRDDAHNGFERQIVEGVALTKIR